MAAIPVFVAAFVLSATAMGSRFAMAQLDPTGPVDLWAASNSGLRDDGGLSKRLIVSYKEKGILDQGSLLGSTRSNDIESAQVLSRAAGIELVVLSDTADAKEVAYRIAQDPLVSYVEPDQMVSILSYEPNDPWLQEGRMWNLEDVQAPEAWEFLKSVDREGVDVVVCVIDTG